MPYSIHEPAPHHPPLTMGHGRGGFGNRTRPLPPSTIKAFSALEPQQPHSLPSTYKHCTHITPTYSTGRGGVGNMHNAGDDRRIFSFDEELAKQGKVAAAPVYHIGRGGQGNAVVESRRRESDASSKTSEGSKRGSLDWVRGLARTSKP